MVSAIAARSFIESHPDKKLNFLVLVEISEVIHIGKRFNSRSQRPDFIFMVFENLPRVLAIPFHLKVHFLSLETRLTYKALPWLKGIGFVTGVAAARRMIKYMAQINLRLDETIMIADNSYLRMVIRKLGFKICYLEHGISSYRMSYLSPSRLINAVKIVLDPVCRAANIFPDEVYLMGKDHFPPHDKKLLCETKNGSLNLSLMFKKILKGAEPSNSFGLEGIFFDKDKLKFVLAVPDFLFGKELIECCQHVLNELAIEHQGPTIVVLKSHPRNDNLETLRRLFPACKQQVVVFANDLGIVDVPVELMLERHGFTLISTDSSALFYACFMTKKEYYYLNVVRSPFNQVLAKEYGFIADRFKKNSKQMIEFG